MYDYLQTIFFTYAAIDAFEVNSYTEKYPEDMGTFVGASLENKHDCSESRPLVNTYYMAKMLTLRDSSRSERFHFEVESGEQKLI